MPNRTPIHIVQHPRETYHPFGTVRFAKLGLENVTVETADGLVPSELLPSMVTHQGAGLIFPSPNAPALDALAESDRPTRLIFLDGTWAQVRTLFRINPCLGDLPHYAIAPTQPSRYLIRKEPSDECISTIEAVVEALQVLEPDTPHLDALVEAFQSMVSDQLPFRALRPRRKRPRPFRPSRAISPRLLGPAESVVAMYAEFSRDPRSYEQNELLYLTALNLGTGEWLREVVQPQHAPDDRQLKRIGLSRTALREGLCVEAVKEKWVRFAGHAVVATWNHSTFTFLHDALAMDQRDYDAVAFKESYCNWRRRSAGTIVDALASEGLEKIACQLPGRPERFMSALLPLLRFVRREEAPR